MASYLQTVMADGPVAYWRLGESVGPTAVEGINGLNGTYINNPTLGRPGLVGVDGNTAVAFDRASSQYVDVADNNLLDFGNGPFTYELWFSSNSASTQTFIGKGTGAMMLQLNTIAAGRINANVKGAGINVFAAGPYNDGIARHLVFTRAAGGPDKLFINGVDVTTPNDVNPTSSNATNLNIGRDVGVGNAMDGTLDEVALYAKVLTPAQVAAHYAARNNPTDFGGNRHGLLKRLDPIAEDDDIYYLLGIL